MKRLLKKVVLCSITLAALFALTGCSKKSMTAAMFKERMTAKGYDVKDVTSQYYYSNAVEKGYVAIDSGKNYQIEFFQLKDEESAISMYNTNKSKFESEKGSSSMSKNMDGKNFSKFALTTNGKYKVVCRVDNTLIYLNVSTKYKDEAADILDYLGY